MEIVPLNLPKAHLRLTRRNDQVFVWCIVRKKELVCTPEEWVRQHLIHYLVDEKEVPLGLVASEYSLEYNGLSKRADIVVFDRVGSPRLLIECKAPEVPITEQTFYQMAQYNFKLNVEYFVLTNGLQHIVGKIDKQNNAIQVMNDFPNKF